MRSSRNNNSLQLFYSHGDRLKISTQLVVRFHPSQLLKEVSKQSLLIRWFPSSKTCNACGTINKGLKISDRVYDCECGYSVNRDLNASYNLRDYQLSKG